MAWSGDVQERNYDQGWADADTLQANLDATVQERNYLPGEFGTGSIMQSGSDGDVQLFDYFDYLNVFGWWKEPDYDPPYLDNQDPLPSATGVDKDDFVEFDLLDDYTGVVLSTVRVYVEGNIAYNGATDVFNSPYDEVDSARTVITDGHRFVVDKSVWWDSSSTVSVRIVAEDNSGNLLDTTYNFDVEDYLNPSIDTNAPTGTGVVESSDITFSTKDESGGSGIDSATINATVDGTPAITSGAFQAGFTGSIIGNAFNGYDVVITPDVDLDSGASYGVSVSVDDLDGNSAIPLVWYFTVQDWLGPAISPTSPLSSAVGVSVDTNIMVEVTDETGLTSDSVTVEVDKDGLGFDLAYEQGGTPEFKDGWNGTNSAVSPITGGYRITIDPEEDFQAATLIQVRVVAEDSGGNPARLV